MFSPAVEAALALAGIRHHGQVRRDTGAPYLVHLCHVALLLARLGESDEVLITALLHDVLEDTVKTPDERREVEAEIERQFGSSVLTAVQTLTEPKRDREGHPIPWPQRKRQYLAQLTQGDRTAALVSAADKLHNLETLLSALEARPPEEVWAWFTGDPAATLWFYRQVSATLQPKLGTNHPLLESLQRGLGRLEALDFPANTQLRN